MRCQWFLGWVFCLFVFSLMGREISAADGKYNVLFIISDDLTSTALSCYGNQVCDTPNIDRLAARGVRFTHAYCQGTYCGPSRASFMSGYYPHATGVLGYISPRKAIGDRETWAEHFKNAGYYTARVSKIFHMGVPGGIEDGSDGADDPRSWTERFNSPGPEWKAPGTGETLEGNPDGKKPVVGGNTFVVVEADGDDLVHSDGKTAAKACELIEQHKDQPFFLGVGFVRPHVPFVAPRPDYQPFPFDDMTLPDKVPGDWDDIPLAGINYKTSKNMQMDVRKQKKALGGYYASVKFMDRQVGKVLDALEKAGLDDKTIVIFTSDHGYHLGEHDFWAKVSLHEESALVPLIISVPGKSPAVCHSFVELLDLYPTISHLCGLDVPGRLQGKNIAKLLDDPTQEVRDTAFCVNGRGFLLRDKNWAYIQYAENASKGIELFDMQKDPKQYNNLANSPEHKPVVERFQKQLAEKLKAVRANDLKDNAPAAVGQTYQVTKPPAEMKLPDFYEKYVDASGYPIVSSGQVNDYALKEAAFLVDLMLAKRPDVRKAMVESGSRLIVMAHNEYTTDIPEYQRMKPKDYWDARARGLGGSRTDPVCSCGEENLLAYNGDPYHQENILIHEFAHNIHLRGMVRVDKTFDDRLKKAYDSAMANGLWAGVYASTNHHEYFAEGVQSWFDNNRPPDHDHNHVDTRKELREYDPQLAALCEEVFGDTKLVYTNPTTRLTGHLAGYDPKTAPTFSWPERLDQQRKDIRKKAEDRNAKAASQTPSKPLE